MKCSKLEHQHRILDIHTVCISVDFIQRQSTFRGYHLNSYSFGGGRRIATFSHLSLNKYRLCDSRMHL
jgi:hypothetical protein